MKNATRAPANLSRRKKFFFYVILLSLIFAVLELGSAWGLRLLRGYDGEHLYQYEFDAYKNLLPARNFVETRGIRHNSEGFRRTTDVSRAKPTGTYRIFLMGASTAYGLGGLWPHLQREYAVVDNSETIDAYLERYLNAALPGIQVEVINAAITSTWTHHHLIYLNQTILKYDPDIVLFLDGYNDFYQYDRNHDQFASYSYNLPSRIIMGDPTFYSFLYMNGWWLFRKSAFVHLVGRRLRVVRRLLSPAPEQVPIDVAKAMEALEQVFPNNALKMHRRSGLILKDEGVIPVFLLQPMLILERDRQTMTEMEQSLFDFNVQSTRPNYEELMHRSVEFVRAREEEMAGETGAHFFDLTGIFKTVRGQIYTDYAHLTPHGNSVLARYVADRIVPIIARDMPGKALTASVGALGSGDTVVASGTPNDQRRPDEAASRWPG